MLSAAVKEKRGAEEEADRIWWEMPCCSIDGNSRSWNWLK